MKMSKSSYTFSSTADYTVLGQWILYARAQVDTWAVKQCTTHSDSGVHMAGKVLIFWFKKFCCFLTETFQTASSNSVL